MLWRHRQCGYLIRFVRRLDSFVWCSPMTASKLDAGASGGPDRPEPDCDANDDLCAHCGHSRNADQRLRARLQELEHQTDLLRQAGVRVPAIPHTNKNSDDSFFQLFRFFLGVYFQSSPTCNVRHIFF